MLIAFGSASAAGVDHFSFCGAPSANPYLELLYGLPSLPELPESGELPFVSDVHVRALPDPVVASGETIGFRFSFRHPAKKWAPKRSGIKIRTEVFLIEEHGKARHLVWQGPDRVLFEQTPASVFVTPRSGTYRVDLVFQHRDGRRIARYGAYFHAGPPRVAGRLAVSSNRVSPGNSILVRLENAGTKRLSTGYGYRIERYNGESWEADPTLRYGFTPRPLLRLGPTATFDCFELDIPAEQPVGRYRFVKGIRGRPPAIRGFSVASASE